MHATVPAKRAGSGAAPARPGAAAQSESLVRDLGGFAKFLLHSGGRDFYRAVGELELSISQIRILHLLGGPLPHASLKTLADEIGLSLPAVSRAVDALVHRGLVTRTEDDSDRRAKAVRITAKAKALIGRLTELRVAGISDFVQTLSDEERADLAKALSPICARDEIAPLCVTRKESTE
jgi:DNA-binding MarR family transcriptional regulator